MENTPCNIAFKDNMHKLMQQLRNKNTPIVVAFRATVGVIGTYRIATVYPQTLMLQPVGEGRELWIPNPAACANVVIKTFPEALDYIADICIDNEWQIHFTLPQEFHL